jgi:hypothetical protein
VRPQSLRNAIGGGSGCTRYVFSAVVLANDSNQRNNEVASAADAARVPYGRTNIRDSFNRDTSADKPSIATSLRRVCQKRFNIGIGGSRLAQLLQPCQLALRRLECEQDAAGCREDERAVVASSSASFRISGMAALFRLAIGALRMPSVNNLLVAM